LASKSGGHPRIDHWRSRSAILTLGREFPAIFADHWRRFHEILPISGRHTRLYLLPAQQDALGGSVRFDGRNDLVLPGAAHRPARVAGRHGWQSPTVAPIVFDPWRHRWVLADAGTGCALILATRFCAHLIVQSQLGKRVVTNRRAPLSRKPFRGVY
jgi:hypothetical protein